jgi:hypothetical protein
VRALSGVQLLDGLLALLRAAPVEDYAGALLQQCFDKSTPDAATPSSDNSDLTLEIQIHLLASSRGNVFVQPAPLCGANADLPFLIFLKE